MTHVLKMLNRSKRLSGVDSLRKYSPPLYPRAYGYPHSETGSELCRKIESAGAALPGADHDFWKGSLER